MKKAMVTLLCLFSYFVSQAQDETVNGVLTVRDAEAGILNLQTTDDSWLYTQWFNSTGLRKAWMGFNTDLSGFHVNLENGANKFLIPNGNVGIGTSNPDARLHVNGTTRVNELEINGGSYQNVSPIYHRWLGKRNVILPKWRISYE